MYTALVLSAIAVLSSGCNSKPKLAPLDGATVDAGFAKKTGNASVRVLGVWVVDDANGVLARVAPAERERTAANLAAMSWEFTPGRMVTYANHRQTHDDELTVLEDGPDRVTFQSPSGKQVVVCLPDGRLELETPAWGTIVLRR